MSLPSRPCPRRGVSTPTLHLPLTLPACQSTAEERREMILPYTLTRNGCAVDESIALRDGVTLQPALLQRAVVSRRGRAPARTRRALGCYEGSSRQQHVCARRGSARQPWLPFSCTPPPLSSRGHLHRRRHTAKDSNCEYAMAQQVASRWARKGWTRTRQSICGSGTGDAVSSYCVLRLIASPCNNRFAARCTRVNEFRKRAAWCCTPSEGSSQSAAHPMKSQPGHHDVQYII